MEKRKEVCLLSVVMYAIVGFAGYINQASNYWFVFVLSLLAMALTLSNVFFEEKEVREATRFEWISVISFFVLEAILTVCISILKMPHIGFLAQFNLGVQTLGMIFTMIAIIKYVLLTTRFHVAIKEGIKTRKNHKVTMNIEETSEIASKVEETIAQEEVKEELEPVQEAVYEFTNEEEQEVEVVGIGLKEEPVIATPYMEEEI
jgi:glucan phosphoethanolaminetransferase (alkaline phosphatase superfamily)